jgi:small subunit ribosomal protein S21
VGKTTVGGRVDPVEQIRICLTYWGLLGIWLENQIFLFIQETHSVSAKNLNGGFVLAKVVLRDGESPQKLLQRFRKKVTRSGLMSEVRKRRWFVSRSEQRRMDEKKAIRRLKKRERKKEEYSH